MLGHREDAMNIKMPRRALLGIAVTLALAASDPAASAQSLDYTAFKSKVEPIFLKKRPGHARCYACHADANNAFRLEKLSAGNSFWSEEQSRRNFETVSRLVVRDHPAASRLLMHPLAPEAGGGPFHSGGRQFASKEDPDWQILARWVGGSTK
jgi:hypothetical protein